MMSAQVYTDFFRENRGLVERGSCGLLNGLRDSALSALERFGFPHRRQEEYLHTDIAGWLEPDWGMNLGRVALPFGTEDAFRCSIPHLSTLLYYLVDDSFRASESARRAILPEGVLIGSLKDAAQAHPELLERYYGRIADMERPGIAALNTLFAQDGFVVYVPDNVTVDKPVQLVSLLQSPVSLMATRRILVVLGRNSSLKLLLCDHSAGSTDCIATQVTELFAGEGSHLDYYELEETNRSFRRISELFVHQEADSTVSAAGITLNNGATRNSAYVTLAGRGASLELDGIAIADDDQKVDNLTFVEHRVPDCRSKELFKYVLDDNAVGSFAGKVLVREGAGGTVSEQTNRNICLKRTARMFTQPQLEIYADDVKCSHGATVGQLDEKALFYMRQRCISEEDARTLLMMAFIDEVIDRMSIEPLCQRLRHLVERRFKHGSALCEGCSICK